MNDPNGSLFTPVGWTPETDHIYGPVPKPYTPALTWKERKFNFYKWLFRLRLETE
jgi:hypothetical protein